MSLTSGLGGLVPVGDAAHHNAPSAKAQPTLARLRQASHIPALRWRWEELQAQKQRKAPAFECPAAHLEIVIRGRGCIPCIALTALRRLTGQLRLLLLVRLLMLIAAGRLRQLLQLPQP